MKCPKCKVTLHCGCEACINHSPQLKPKMIVHAGTGNDWNESCPNCDFTQSVHDWFYSMDKIKGDL